MFVVGGISFKASLVLVPNITHEILRTVPASCSECMCAYLIAGAIVGGVVGVVLIMTTSVTIIIIIAVLVMRLSSREKDRTAQVK